MKTTTQLAVLAAFLALAIAPGSNALGADSTEQAQKVKEKIEALRLESLTTRRQVEVTVYELNRLQSDNVELREQFEKYTGELAKMQEQAKVARERAEGMGKEGLAFFKSWEEQIGSIANEKIRQKARGRFDKRQKSYQKIIAAMAEVREVAQPFMSDLNDLKTLLGTELNREGVVSAKDLIEHVNFLGTDVVNALKDVETLLDRMAAELGKYK